MIEIIYQTLYLISSIFFGVVFIPQLYTNYIKKDGNDISLFFIFLWIFGDSLAVLGSVFNNFSFGMLALSYYHIILDIILILQIYFYKDYNYNITLLRTLRDSIYERFEDSNRIENIYYNSMPFYIYEHTLKWFLIFIIYLISLTWLLLVININYTYGMLCGYIATFTFILSRFPQIYKNYKNKKCNSLSYGLFLITILANSSFCIGIILECTRTNKCIESLAWILGTSVTIIFDVIIIIQIYIYREHELYESLE